MISPTVISLEQFNVVVVVACKADVPAEMVNPAFAVNTPDDTVSPADAVIKPDAFNAIQLVVAVDIVVVDGFINKERTCEGVEEPLI